MATKHGRVPKHDRPREREEFSRIQPVSVFRPGKSFAVAARGGELAAIAKRLGVRWLESLSGEFVVESRRGAQIGGQGRLKAVLGRDCVISGDELEERLDAPFTLIFVPEGDPLLSGDGEEDYFGYAHDDIDLGAAMVEQLALEMNPYPRLKGAALADYVDTAPPRTEGAAAPRENPFAALKVLKKDRV